GIVEIISRFTDNLGHFYFHFIVKRLEELDNRSVRTDVLDGNQFSLHTSYFSIRKIQIDAAEVMSGNACLDNKSLIEPDRTQGVMVMSANDQPDLRKRACDSLIFVVFKMDQRNNEVAL